MSHHLISFGSVRYTHTSHQSRQHSGRHKQWILMCIFPQLFVTSALINNCSLYITFMSRWYTLFDNTRNINRVKWRKACRNTIVCIYVKHILSIYNIADLTLGFGSIQYCVLLWTMLSKHFPKGKKIELWVGINITSMTWLLVFF